MSSFAAGLKEIYDEVITIGDFARDLSLLDLDLAVRNNIRVLAEQAIHTELVKAATIAINSIKEYDFEPLKQRFMENISNPNHVYVSTDLGYIRVIDTKLIGNEQDLLSGLYESDAINVSPRARSIAWKYGIYKPEREGLELASKYEKYPSYTEVINKRLVDWGDKAPYWVFINSGTVSVSGGGTPYPTFGGTNFVEKVMGKALDIIKKTALAVENNMISNINDGVTQQLASPRKRLQVEFGRIELGRTAEGKRIQAAAKESKEGTYYQLVIGGRFGKKITADELLMM